MRSAAELIFRARQETANLLLLASPPKFSGEAPLSLVLPEPSAVAGVLRGSEYAGQISQIACSVVEHRFPLLGVEIDTGPEIYWRRDYIHSRESGMQYFRRIPYLNFSAVGDHKVIWELNRHQHLVLLAQAYVFTGEREFTRELFRQLESWFEQNPFQRGINWASALEVGFRALSWVWVYHLTAREMPEDFRQQFLTKLYRHGLHLSENLSIYFSPNTHLLGEAVALYALGVLFPSFPGARKWQQQAEKIIEGQLSFQVQRDGSHFEQSTYYHVYALDLFLLFYILAGRPANFRPVLERMAEYLYWLLGPSRRIAFLGDDDGGRLFHPYGERDQFGRATLATCGILFEKEEWIGTVRDVAEQAAWWLGANMTRLARQQPSIPAGSRVFADSGSAFLQSEGLFVQMDCGPFGYGGAGHSHSDTLSIVVWIHGEPVLRDPGTYTYLSDPEERNWFRGSAAHSTVRMDGLDQGRAAGPFRWNSKPEVNLSTWQPNAGGGLIEAVCRYGQFTHRRRLLLEQQRLLILDELDGPPGEHTCEQVWQLGSGARKVSLSFSAPAVKRPSKYSPAFGKKCPGESVIVELEGQFPMRVAMLLDGAGEMPFSRERITVDEANRILEDRGSNKETSQFSR
jgi:hypothetical protein